MDDGFRWIEDDHRKIEEQFQTYLRDNEEPVLRELCEHLTQHSRVEETVLYPMVRRFVDGGDDLADRAQEEHAQIATMVAALYDSATPDRISDLVANLHRSVTEHVEEEESTILPALRDCPVDAGELAAELESAGAAR
jgi:hemerythrin superfamily protein